jgi:hypothetical protein
MGITTDSPQGWVPLPMARVTAGWQAQDSVQQPPPERLYAMNQISEADHGNGRRCLQGERARITSVQRGVHQAARRVWPAVVAMEVLFALGLVMAIALGRGAVVLVCVLAFVLAAYFGARLSASARLDDRRAENSG